MPLPKYESLPIGISYAEWDDLVDYYAGKCATKLVTMGEGGDYNCDGVNDGVQIQAAFDALPAAGGIVFLGKGVYDMQANYGETAEPKTGIYVHNVDKFWLIGEGFGTILKMSAGADRTIAHIKSCSNFGIKNLAFDCNKANNTNQDDYPFTHGLLMDFCDNFIVDNIYAYDSRQDGVSSSQNTNGIFSKMLLRGCMLDGFCGHDQEYNVLIDKCIAWENGHNGISYDMQEQDTGTLHSYDVTIANCIAHDNTELGISVYQANSNMYRMHVIGNKSYDNGFDGMYFDGTIDSIIANNIIRNNSQYGMRVINSLSNIISNNIIFDNFQHGLSLGASTEDCHNNLVTDNLIHDNNQDENGWNGIDIYGNYNKLSNNKINDNYGYEIYVRSGTANELTLNNVLVVSRSHTGTIADDGTSTVIQLNNGHSYP